MTLAEYLKVSQWPVRVQDNNHMIISVEAEKAFNQLWCSLTMKIIYTHTWPTEVIYEYLILNTEYFLHKFRNKIGISALSTHLFSLHWRIWTAKLENKKETNGCFMTLLWERRTKAFRIYTWQDLICRKSQTHTKLWRLVN